MDFQSKMRDFLEKVPQSRSDRGDNSRFEWLNRETGCPTSKFQREQQMPIERNTAEIDGQPLHYLRAGSGSPLLLLHGLLGGAFCWRRNVDVLSHRRTIFAVDLPGLGACDAPRDLDCSMAAQAQRVLSLLEQLKLQNVDVVGSSWGGAIAMFIAAQSRCLRSLVLAAPVNPWSDFGAGRIRFLKGRLGAALLRIAWPVSRPLHGIAVERMYGDPRRVPAGTIEGYSSLAMRPGKVHSVLNTLRSWEDDVSALSKAIPRITVPSLLIWGTRDGAVDLRSAEHLRRALPASELRLIDGAGHLPFEETPDEFNRLVLDFVERTRAGSGSA
jgi:pimeloyl-ACP methyl ester carboxylesterase